MRGMRVAIGAALLVLCCPGPASARGSNHGLPAGVAAPAWAKRTPIHFLPSAALAARSETPRRAGSEQQALAPGGLSAGSPLAREGGAPLGEGGPPLSGFGALEQRDDTDRPLRFRGNSGVQHEPHVYLIFWGQSWETSYASLRTQLTSLYEGLSGSSFQGILTQYFDAEGWISPTVSSTSYLDATVPAPSSVGDAGLQQEVASALAANPGWTADFDAQFVVLPAPGTTYEAGFQQNFCGYHGITELGDYSYTFVPYIGEEPFHKGCIGYGASNAIVESMVASHEYAESATDPQLDAWTTAGGYEVADLCATHAIEVTSGPLAGSWIQPLWDESQSTCSISNPDPPHVLAVSEPGTSPAWHEIRLSGVVNPEGADTHYRFEYGPTTAYGSSLPAGEADAGSGLANVAVGRNLTGLAQGIYHYRLVATNSSGTVAGEDRVAVSAGFAPQDFPQVPDTEAHGVACPGEEDCIAVGEAWSPEMGTLVPMAARWNGEAWTPMRTPSPPGLEDGWRHNRYAVLSGVACTSGSDCTAVGYFRDGEEVMKPLVERWDGSEWAIAPAPFPAGAVETRLWSVSCASPSECTAVGSSATGLNDSQAVAEHWDGSAWALEPVPVPSGVEASYLGGVSCASASACTAVGYYETRPPRHTMTLAERWDGSHWAVQQSVNPSGGVATNSLWGVSCAAADACTAVGKHVGEVGGGSEESTLAERWDGAQWSVQQTKDPSPSLTEELLSVSCATAESCTAVGSYRNPSASGDWKEVLAERWNGGEWTILGVPEVADPPENWHERELTGVACTAPSACVVVGWGLTAPARELATWEAIAETELEPPFASFSVSTETPAVRSPIDFDASSSGEPADPIASYEWDFGDGSRASGPTPSHAYEGSGYYEVVLTVTDAEGHRGKVMHHVYIPDLYPPTASFTATPESTTVGEPVMFDASASSDPDGPIEMYTWHFGDGHEANGPKNSHAFFAPGEYTVTLSIHDSGGEYSTASQVITVAEGPLPLASFSASPEAPLPGQPVAFDASASSDPRGRIESYEWDFGDGSRASGPTPSHTYPSSGEYTVTLAVTDDWPRTGTISRTIRVSEPAVPGRGDGGQASASAPNAFSIRHASVRCDGRIAVGLTAPARGTFAARASIESGAAGTAADAKASGGTRPTRCSPRGRMSGLASRWLTSIGGAGVDSLLSTSRSHKRSQPYYGSGSASSEAASPVELSIDPSAFARSALRAGRLMTVDVAITFTPDGGAPMSKHKIVVVHPKR